MYIVQSYPLAILFCFITMLCWGSWGNTQKLAGKTWRYELFYWDYVIGILLFSLVWALTVGSCGTEGRKFLPDLAQASWGNIGSAFVGGVVFNAANILLSAAIAVAGMAVAFPVGIGLALVLGVLINYIGSAKGDPVLLFGGVALVIVAIVLNGIAYKMISRGNRSAASSRGIVLALLDLDNFVTPAAGKMTPYSAMVVFAVGIFLSTFIFNSIAMKRPVSGTPVSISAYFKGGFPIHLVGVLGGVIWGLGNALNLIAAGKAGAAISYGLGQGATLVAALWGVFVWKEFRGGGRRVDWLLGWMFALFVAGIGLIIAAGN